MASMMALMPNVRQLVGLPFFDSGAYSCHKTHPRLRRKFEGQNAEI
jgi:hypothetical protein